MKKAILLIGLIVALSSCGGGGGGGAQQSNEPTPLPPTSIDKGVQPGNPENIGNSGLPIGNGNTGTLPPSTTPSNPVATSFSKPINQGVMTGKNVKVGVLDGDFLSGNKAETKNFHTRIENGFEISETFENVKKLEFGNRLIVLPRADNKYSQDEHGLIVASIAAGKNGKGATQAEVYGASFGREGGKIVVEYEKYEELHNQGVRIYNQSFGTPIENTKYNQANYKNKLQGLFVDSIGQTEQQLEEKVNKLLNFYRNSIQNDGALFIWAAGNTIKEDKKKINPTETTPESGLPIFDSSLQKGWIAVVGVKPNGEEYDGDDRLARAGRAAYWTISASGECSDYLSECRGYGSSYAAPKVTATALKIKERFPWMTGHEIQQTILTTADDKGIYGVDSVFGWGFLNEEKALKGPAQFNNKLITGNDSIQGQFNANVSENMISIFENDISGDSGLKKSGKGSLILTGNNTYNYKTDIEEGTLEIYGQNSSDISISSNGTLITYPTAMIGKINYIGDIVPKNVTNNGGTFENRGSGARITGNYTATANSITRAEFGTKIKIDGVLTLQNGSTLQLLSNKYVPVKAQNAVVIESQKEIVGNFDKVEAAQLLNAESRVNENSIEAQLSRKNVKEYVEKLSDSDEMQKNSATNIEIAFQKLDEEIENGTSENLENFKQKAATLQALTSSNRAAVLDSLSGQIYASAQALTFQHSQTVNKDLSNRLVMLGTLDNVGDKFGMWFSGFGANGKLKQEGYGEGNTKVFGGQVGIDKQFGRNLILGTALSYSEADVKFNRYGGKSNADNFGISLYGRLGNKSKPLYLQGRLGIGFVDSDVERDIILSTNDFSKAKINHNDKVVSGYLETGYDFKNRAGDFTVTPFAAISYDSVKRGAFSEENSQFGLTADKKTYDQTSGLIGIRVGKAIDWNNGSKTTFQGYLTHQRAFNDENLSFEASYSGLLGAKFTVKGIGLPKNKTWVGVGALTELNKNIGWYVNYDGAFDSGNGKGNNNVFTTGVRVNF